MKEKMTIAQLRSTIFLQQNFGYTPETAKEFGDLLLPGAKVYGIAQPGVPMLGVNPTMPQYGLSWRLFKKQDDGCEYNIAFQPGKIDIVLTKETPYGDETELKFCKQSAEWFRQILAKRDKLFVQRIAYAPLYAIKINGDTDASSLWNGLLKKTIIDGIQAQDINLQFLLKRIVTFGGEEIQMNLLYQIFDGTQTKAKDDQVIVDSVFLIQLDLNSVPEKILSLDSDGVDAFYNEILSLKNNLIDNVCA